LWACSRYDEKLYSGSIVHYIPAILGNRLPKNIIDKMVDDLTDTEKFLSLMALPPKI
jgi:hypothetical protein